MRADIFRIKANDSIIYGYCFIGSIYFILYYTSLTYYFLVYFYEKTVKNMKK